MSDRLGIHESIMRPSQKVKTYHRTCAMTGCRNKFTTNFHYQIYCKTPECELEIAKMRAAEKARTPHRKAPNIDSAMCNDFLSRPLR